MPNDNYDPSEAKRQLQEAVASGQCLAFVGAGPVAGIYGTWDGLLDRICDRINYTKPAGVSREELADQLKSHNINGYKSALRAQFSQTELMPRIYKSILKIGFKAIVTTNFDATLPTAAAETLKPSDYVVIKFPSLNPQFNGPLRICHIHGLITRDGGEDEILLSADDFENGYKNTNSSIEDFLNIAFTFYHACFIGYTFSEKSINNIFEMSRARSDKFINEIGQRRKCFSFVEESRLTDDEIKRLEYFGVTPIPYKKHNDQHVGLREMLEEIFDKCPPSSINQPQWNGENEISIGEIR